MTTSNKKIAIIALTYSCNFNCHDCYARGLNNNFPQYFLLEDFEKLSSWLKEQDFSQFSFIGGEPTTHPKFKEIMDICSKEQIAFTISTNLLFGDFLMKEMLKNSCLIGVTIDYILPYIKNKKEKERYFANLKILKDNPRIGKALFFRLPLPKKYHKELMQIAKEYNTRLSARFLLPGFLGKQTSLDKLKDNIRQSFELIRELKEKEINFTIVDPSLRCAFSDDEWEELRKNKNGEDIMWSRCYTGEKYHVLRKGPSNYTDRMAINPDLSIFPCFPTFFKTKSILEFNNIEEVEEIFRKFFEKWRWEIPLAEECKKCKYFLSKECQGSCLHNKYHKEFAGKIVDIEKVI